MSKNFIFFSIWIVSVAFFNLQSLLQMYRSFSFSKLLANYDRGCHDEVSFIWSLNTCNPGSHWYCSWDNMSKSFQADPAKSFFTETGKNFRKLWDHQVGTLQHTTGDRLSAISSLQETISLISGDRAV